MDYDTSSRRRIRHITDIYVISSHLIADSVSSSHLIISTTYTSSHQHIHHRHIRYLTAEYPVSLRPADSESMSVLCRWQTAIAVHWLDGPVCVLCVFCACVCVCFVCVCVKVCVNVCVSMCVRAQMCVCVCACTRVSCRKMQWRRRAFQRAMHRQQSVSRPQGRQGRKGRP